jgi:hypothetical protein
VTEESTPSRLTGLREALWRFVLVCVAVAAVLGLLAALIAFATGHRVSSAIAVAYYLVGCALVLIGVFPTGGFSLVRGTMTRRRPVGARDDPFFFIGAILIGLGVLADIYSF